MSFKNKKGMTMVEASMVFPFVILSVMALIAMLLFFYRQVEVQCRLDIAARQASGEMTKTVFCLEREAVAYEISKNGRERVYGRESIAFAEQGLLKSRRIDLEVNMYLVECGAWIRRWDLLNDAKEGNFGGKN